MPTGQLFVEGVPISPRQWHFVALSRSQSTRQGFVYVDGALTRTFTPTPANLSTTNTPIVGAPFSALGWEGGLDEVEIYNRALSTNELYSIYSAGSAGKCKPCCYLQVLTIARVNPDSVEVNWGGCGVLEESPTLVGPNGTPAVWTPIPNAASPYVIPATGQAMFYRLDCQINP